MEIQGSLIKINPAEQGKSNSGKDWTKQSFVLETEGQYPKKVLISLFGEKVNLLMGIQLFDKINVSINIESREYNDKYYTEVQGWKITKI